MKLFCSSDTLALQGDLNKLLPEELGHAAAYEAYRKFIHHSSMREPLSAEPERQREALIALAMAESKSFDLPTCVLVCQYLIST